ncbi:Hypothetical predicted protein [Olea europaea subsp. europaea]|uniref:Uncharacterized protein n=1 Tax=Olea europaea subsp. europaea TaxID=158383 RepID=A0A8S0SZD5_OLEEU|nr:Hypothetical predicted protein [Olea europaea subsp. europaea]
MVHGEISIAGQCGQLDEVTSSSSTPEKRSEQDSDEVAGKSSVQEKKSEYVVEWISLIGLKEEKRNKEKLLILMGLDSIGEGAQQVDYKNTFTIDEMGLNAVKVYGPTTDYNLGARRINLNSSFDYKYPRQAGTTKEEEMLEALASPSSEVFEPGSPPQNKLDKIKASMNRREDKYVNGLANSVEVHIVKPVGLILERAQSGLDYIVYEMDDEPLGPTTHYTSSTDRLAVSNVGQPSDSNSPCYKGSSSSQFRTIDSELFQTA